MKLKLAFGFLPYLQFTKSLKGTTVGSSKFFVVWLDPKAEPHTEKHEEMHVAWWYAVSVVATLALLYFVPLPFALLGTLVDPLAGTFIRAYKRLEESFAYAYAAKHHPRPMQYIDAVAESPTHKKRYGEDFGDKVRNVYRRWFA